MYESLIKKAQIVLLLAAVAVAGIAFLPAASSAGDPPEDPCGAQSPCNGGNLMCAMVRDPVTGEWERCRQSFDCY
jgi:hypothetical protein